VAGERVEAMASNSPTVLQGPPPAGDWQTVAGRLTDWTPRFFSPSAQVNQTYGKDASRVGLYVGYYRNQRPGAQLISSYNTLVPSNDRAWKNIGDTRRTLAFDQREISAIESSLRGRSTSLLVWRWYWVDGQYIVNPYRGKLLQAKSKLLGHGDDGAVVIVYAPYEDQPLDAEQALKDFVGTMLPAITRSLEYARRAEPSS